MEYKGYVYILKSSATDKLYIGSTRNLNQRLHAHNSGKVKSTKSGKPYIILYSEKFDNYSSARKRELFLKSGVGRKWIRETIIESAH